jgi:hypothetical protein
MTNAPPPAEPTAPEPTARFTIVQIADRFWIRDNDATLNPLSAPRATRRDAEIRLGEIVREHANTGTQNAPAFGSATRRKRGSHKARDAT